MSATLGILGGDRRFQLLASRWEAEGRPVLTAALGLPRDLPPLTLAASCDVLLLPLPLTRDGAALHAPLAPAPVPLSEDLAAALSGKRLAAGGLFSLERAPASWRALPFTDYSADEAFLAGNADLTARTALAHLLLHTPDGLPGARVLVLGWGRIAKALAPLLREQGAHVTVAARSPDARAAAARLGFAAADLTLAQPFDALINTIPAPVAGEDLLSRQAPGTLLLELASAPGGFHRPTAVARGLSLLDAPGLPGKLAPRAAAALLKTTLERMML